MNFVLIFLITIFSLSLFFYGRSKTKSIAIEKNIKLNALPKFYGYYLVLWCSIPSLVFLLIKKYTSILPFYNYKKKIY